MSSVQYNAKGQAIPAATKAFGAEAFTQIDHTEIRWLGGAGALINSRGTTIMIDPVFSGFDMPLLIDVPITESQVPYVDSVLLTHSDGDHYSRKTCKEIAPRVDGFHAPHYVADLLHSELNVGSTGHGIGDRFSVGDVKVTLTPAWHTWQNELPDQERVFLLEDCCGFWLDTPDGSIWAVGDSRLMPEHLDMPHPDVMLFDFSDSSWHIGLDGAVQLANAHPDTKLILWHWGSVDAPDWKEFNGDPNVLRECVANPERILVLAPGEAWQLEKKQRVSV